MKFLTVLVLWLSLSLAATAAAAQSPNVSVSLSASPATAKPGDRVSFTAHFTNHSVGEVWLDGELEVPAGLTQVSSSSNATGNHSFQATRALVTDARLAAGTSFSMIVVAEMEPGVVHGTVLTGEVEAKLRASDGGGILDRATATVTVDAVAPAPVPTLTEWAMILLGAGLAGGAALTLHRRRQFH